VSGRPPDDEGPAPTSPIVPTGMRSIPRVVWIITLFHALLLSSYSILVPLYRGPDEAGHVDMVLKARHRFDYPDYDRAYYSQQVLRSRDLTLYDRGSAHLRTEEALPREARPSFSELAPPLATVDSRNLLATHPPLYYAGAGAVTIVLSSLTPTAEWSFDQVVGILRLLNVLLVSGLPALAFLISRRIGWSKEVSTAAALVPLAIPMFTNIGSTVNNDNLLTLLVAVLLLFLVRVMTGDLSPRTAVLAGAAAGLALLTKGFAVAAPLWVGAAYAVAAIRGRPRDVVVRRMGLALVVAVAVGGWWWVRNVLVFDALQPGTDIDPRPPAGESFVPDGWGWARVYSLWTAQRFWGAFGALDVYLPDIAIWIASAVFLGGIILAFIWRSRSRLQLLVLMLPFLTTAAIVTYGAYGAYLRLGQPVGFHGRYFFPALSGIAGIVALGLTRVLGRRNRLLTPSILVGAIAMQVLAIGRIVPHYWGAPAASLAERFDSILAWSPWPPAVVILAFVTTGLVGIWLVAEVIRGSVRDRSSDRVGHQVERGSERDRVPS
jgi:small subunit ribosomal protein S36